MVFHVLNRANARARIFAKEDDYAAFERVMKETFARKPMRVLGYVIMPNHWHLVLCPNTVTCPVQATFPKPPSAGRPRPGPSPAIAGGRSS